MAVPAQPADRFVDSVGICTHLQSAPYDRDGIDPARMIAALGIRHVRDEMRPDNDLARWRRVAAAGLRLHLLASPATNTVAALLDFVAALGPDAVSAVEGQNEGDSDWFKAQPAAADGWAPAVIAYQRALFEAIRRRFPQIPVLSPTVLDYRPDDMLKLRPAAAACDAVALHAYVQERQAPETADAYSGIDWYLRQMRDRFKPGAPAMVTETGYATGTGGISPAAAAIYLPRLLLHLFGRGIERSFLYELMDEGSDRLDAEQNWGLVAVDGTAKPAFEPIRLLLTALADPGPAFRAAPVLVRVAGPADLRFSAFRKRDGEAVLAIWRARPAWDRATGRDVALAAQPARLLVPAGASASALPLEAGGVWSSVPAARGQVTLMVSARVQLVRLRDA